MREIAKLVGVLTLICVVCSALLAAVYEQTREPIDRAATARKLTAARDVLPPGAPEPRQVSVGGVTNFASVRGDGTLVATAVEGRSTKGYGGDVVLMVGISADGKVLDFRVIQAKETPGLGSKIGAPVFKKGVCGRSIDGNWTVKKDGGDIDAITAATISSRAALDAIRDAIAWHQQWLNAQAIPAAPAATNPGSPVEP